MTTLRKGSKGAEVKTLQTALNRAGASITVDGDYGNKTEEAVKTFQKAHGLTDDGVCGAKTWAKLEIYLCDLEDLGRAILECIQDIHNMPSFAKVLELMKYVE